MRNLGKKRGDSEGGKAGGDVSSESLRSRGEAWEKALQEAYMMSNIPIIFRKSRLRPACTGVDNTTRTASGA